MSLKILIRGLPADFDEEELLELCEEFGDVTAASFLSDSRTGRRAWVEYSEQWEAECALGELDGAAIEESYLTVSVWDPDAEEASASDDEDEDEDDADFDDEDDADFDEEEEEDDDYEEGADEAWDEAAEEY